MPDMSVDDRYIWRVITNLDLVHDIKAILVPLVRERNSNERIHQAVCITCSSCKGVAEVGRWVCD